jgi:hypothetical protein
MLVHWLTFLHSAWATRVNSLPIVRARRLLMLILLSFLRFEPTLAIQLLILFPSFFTQRWNHAKQELAALKAQLKVFLAYFLFSNTLSLQRRAGSR